MILTPSTREQPQPKEPLPAHSRLLVLVDEARTVMGRAQALVASASQWSGPLPRSQKGLRNALRYLAVAEYSLTNLAMGLREEHA